MPRINLIRVERRGSGFRILYRTLWLDEPQVLIATTSLEGARPRGALTP